MRPRLLDLFCGAGGAAEGYHRAGFDVVGVDIEPQPRYPFAFVLGDALEYVRKHGREFDAIHASPPCQRYSAQTRTSGRNRHEYPDLVAAAREALEATGKPYVIENVAGAPLRNPITLCGASFGLTLYRHRLFESSALLAAPAHVPHEEVCPRAGRGASAKGFICVAGNFADIGAARKAMGIGWMARHELAQAIPPAYTEHIGRQLLATVEAAR